MPINLEIEIFIFLVRYVIVLLVLLAFTGDKLFPHYMCLTLITIYCLACCSSNRRGQTPTTTPLFARVQQQQQQQQQQAAAVAAAWRHGHFRPADQDL